MTCVNGLQEESQREEKSHNSISELRYVTCWTEDDGLYYCGCDHKTNRGSGSMHDARRAHLHPQEGGWLVAFLK